MPLDAAAGAIRRLQRYGDCVAFLQVARDDLRRDSVGDACLDRHAAPLSRRRSGRRCPSRDVAGLRRRTLRAGNAGPRWARRVRSPVQSTFARHVGRHAGFELQIRIRHVDDCRVRHDVLHRLRRQPDLRDPAVKRLRWDTRRPRTQPGSAVGTAPRRLRRCRRAPASGSGRWRSGTAPAPAGWRRRFGRRRHSSRRSCRRSAP